MGCLRPGASVRWRDTILCMRWWCLRHVGRWICVFPVCVHTYQHFPYRALLYVLSPMPSWLTLDPLLRIALEKVNSCPQHIPIAVTYPTIIVGYVTIEWVMFILAHTKLNLNGLLTIINHVCSWRCPGLAPYLRPRHTVTWYNYSFLIRGAIPRHSEVSNWDCVACGRMTCLAALYSTYGKGWGVCCCTVWDAWSYIVTWWGVRAAHSCALLIGQTRSDAAIGQTRC